MIVLAGVDASGVSPVLWAYLGLIARMHRGEAAAELVITSLRRPQGPRPSLHSPLPGELCRAVDLRRWALDEKDRARIFCAELRGVYGAALGVVLEPEELTVRELALRGGRASVQPHIHVQLKPGATLREL